ncbi:MAG: hypothetical protein SH807_05540 [Blastochloris sp.]|nr:hypothetical protein [Blastochloris sp.]
MNMLKLKNFLYNRWLWAGLGLALLGLTAAIFLGPKLIYGNPTFASWVQKQISVQTEGKFNFETIHGGTFSADLKNLSLDLGSTSSNVRKVVAPDLNASFALLPLLQNKLVVTSIHMKGGTLDLRLNGADAAQISLPAANHFRLQKGTVNLSNLSGWNIQLDKCDLIVHQSGSKDNPNISGSLQATTAQIANLTLQSLELDFKIENGTLMVENLKAQLPGKSKLRLNGSYTLFGQRKIQTDLTLDSPDILSLLKALDFSERFAGEADVKLSAEGQFTPSLRSLTGSGKAKLNNIKPDVKMPSLPGFIDIPLLRRIRALNDLDGDAAFTLQAEKINITNLDLKNKDLRISGTAQVGYDRHLNSQLLFKGNKTVSEEIPNIARSSFEHDAEGNVVIPFSLIPTTRDPQVDIGDIVNKIISNPVKVLNPLNLFK